MRSFLTSVVLATSVLSGAASAQSAPRNLTEVMPTVLTMTSSELSLTLGRSEPMTAARSFNKIAVSDGDILDVTPISDTQFLVRGKAVGRTNIIIYRDGSLVQMVEVLVTQDVASIQADLKALFPQHTFRLRRVSDKLYVEGEVADSGVERRVLDVLQSYAPDNVINAMTVAAPRQVALKVRFLEASRDAVKELGLGNVISRPGDFAFTTAASIITGSAPNTSGTLFGGSGSTSMDLMVRALEEKGIVRTLAEPNLVASSGQPASFLAGGEFPVPVAAEDQRVTIEFREFGVSLDFTPEVLSSDRVHLKVQPEVSQIDSRNAIRISGFEIPALIVRKADTAIDLRDGQTFAIAGLLQNSYDNDVIQTPFLGDMPVLGSLFRSTRFRERETELVILVTPTLITAAEAPNDVAELQHDKHQPTQAELFFLGRIEDTSTSVEG